ncbi:hypothetical protein [Mesorhizobium sangaii]|uniref:DUF4365 domain-containing protein n=1 Tax=Mesorhizobium sangaii TaxID=505389 RepID=A0A841PU20_9HYPH|nr:hypothetical protein [Mesorhizobium sangaii]MBB6411855.1 hypothetical protein [Mesorhizobium sangaii]
MTRQLNSDELGEHGEGLFPSLCTPFGLVVNKSMRDRTGWDYRVEFPNKYLDTKTYPDKRPALPAYNFQVKSMWADRKSFSAHLLSMERLAKTAEPSFIFVMKFRSDLSVEKAFLIHLGDGPLNQVLKRLTAESTKGKPIRSQKVTFTEGTDWYDVPMEPHAFFARVQELSQAYAAGGDYAEAKRKQIETAGYSDSPVQIKVTIQGKDGKELIDGFLGLAPLHVTSFSTIEERFGFQRPFGPQFSGPGIMSFKPTGGPKCKIFLRYTRNGVPVVREGHLIIPPVKSASRFLVALHPVTLDINLAGTLNFTVADLNSEVKSLSWWKEVARALDILFSDQFCFDLYAHDGTKLFGVEIFANTNANQAFADWLRVLLRAVNRMLSVIDRVGMSDIEFCISDIEMADAHVARCVALVDEIGTLFTLKLDDLTERSEDLIGEPMTGIVAQSLRLGSAELMYCSVTEMTMIRDQAGQHVLQATTTKQGFLEGAGSDTLESYARSCARHVGAQYLIVWG